MSYFCIPIFPSLKPQYDSYSTGSWGLLELILATLEQRQGAPWAVHQSPPTPTPHPTHTHWWIMLIPHRRDPGETSTKGFLLWGDSVNHHTTVSKSLTANTYSIYITDSVKANNCELLFLNWAVTWVSLCARECMCWLKKSSDRVKDRWDFLQASVSRCGKWAVMCQINCPLHVLLHWWGQFYTRLVINLSGPKLEHRRQPSFHKCVRCSNALDGCSLVSTPLE